MVAHAVYREVSLLACASEVAPGSIAAIAGHIAGRTTACATGSSGRPAAMAVAEATTHRGVVAITRHRTVAAVH